MEQIAGILMDAFFIGLLIWCSYTDIRKRIVSNIAIVLLLCLGIVHTGLMPFTQSTWWTYPLGMVFAIPFFISWLKGGMGAGDVKLVMAITLYMGVLNTVFAFALMIPVLIVLMARSLIREKTWKCRIPVAPILAFGAIGSVFAGYLYALTSI
jgi:Flp pilus assembly protein protease CpaA